MTIRLERDPDAPVATLIIDRPEAKNACTIAMWADAADHLAAAGSDDDVAVLLITGTGDAFCAGADVREMMTPAAQTAEARGQFHRFLDELDHFPKPLVAVVNGIAVGAGLTMLCYADIVLASSSARFKAPFVEMGLTAEAGSTQLLPQRIGWQATAHLLFTGTWLDAQGALASGLVWRLHEPDELAGAAMELARAIAAMPLSSLRETKCLLVAANRDVSGARARESEAFGRLLAVRADQNPT